jgi:hypothetical protein
MACFYNTSPTGIEISITGQFRVECLGDLRLSSNKMHTVCHLRIRVYIKTVRFLHSGFGGLEVACWPLELKFAGSNPAQAVGFFRAKKKSSARLPSEGKLSCGSHVVDLRHIKDP